MDVHKTLITSASFNGFDEPNEWADQPADIMRYNETNFPLRKALTPHAQSKIPKCFGWDLIPYDENHDSYDFYIWVDANYILKEGAVDFLIKELGDNDILVFPHPFHDTVEDEFNFLRDNLPKSKYLQQRYEGELLEELYYEIDEICGSDKGDLPAYHAAIFIYRNNEAMRTALKEWWYYDSRFHLDDQLTMSLVLDREDIEVKVMDKKIKDYPYWEYRSHKK